MPGSRLIVVFFTLCANLILATDVFADLSEADLKKSLIAVNAYKSRSDTATPEIGTGFVVSSDRYNGYVLTSAQLVSGKESLSVTIPSSNTQLVAQVVRMDPSFDYALLKVNGLNVTALTFAQTVPATGEVVWSAALISGEGKNKVGISQGVLHNDYQLAANDMFMLSHSADADRYPGAVLLNECGEVLGLNMSFSNPDNLVHAISLKSLIRLMGEQNVRPARASSPCVSALVLAREKAQQASTDAEKAREQAALAQQEAQKLKSELSQSNRQNQSLVSQAQRASQKAEEAMTAASMAQKHAEETRVALERKTETLMAETQAMVAHMEQDRAEAEARFRSALQEQKEEAAAREQLLVILFMSFIVILVAVILFLQRGKKTRVEPQVDSAHTFFKGLSSVSVKEKKVSGGSPGSKTRREYVLDGRDEEGIRYLLRISGDQLDEEGVIIGRNPEESPYIINHADVSRKHARLKLMKERVFIEDLGSTNGTSVNGQNIDDRGPVSVANGDQIIIGSVMMKLRVVNG